VNEDTVFMSADIEGKVDLDSLGSPGIEGEINLYNHLCLLDIEDNTCSFRVVSVETEDDSVKKLLLVTPSETVIKTVLFGKIKSVTLTGSDLIFKKEINHKRCKRTINFEKGFYAIILEFE